MPIDQAAMIRSIYDTIFAAYTQPPLPGLPAPSQAANMFLTLEWPGQQLDPSAFQNPWTPMNLAGSQLSNELFAALVNSVPTLSVTYTDSGVTIEEMYQLILRSEPDVAEGNNPVGGAFFEAMKTFEFAKLGSLLNPGLFYRPSYATPANWYDEAASRSWASVTIRSTQTKTVENSPFSKTGGLERVKGGIWKIPNPDVVAVDSGNIARFKKTMPADPVLRSRILTTKRSIDSSTVEKLPTYSTDQLAYQTAQDDYENAVANLNANRFQYDLSNPTQQQQWETVRPQLEATVSAAWAKLQQQSSVDLEIISSRLPTAFLASNILTKSVPVGRISVSPISRIPIDSISVDRISIDKINKINPRILTRKDPLSYESLKQYFKFRDVPLSSETSDLQISFRFCRVAIRRPWLMMSILKLQGWHFTGQSAGSFSTGRTDSNPGSFPLLPTAFIAVRDLKIKGTWSQSDRAIAELAASDTGNTVAFGPFALSGKYGSDQAGSVYKSQFDGQTLSVPGLQILGWMNQVVPFSPPTAS